MKFYLKTYGCQMNLRDSEAVVCLLQEHGYEQVHSEEEADVLLFNTCSVRDHAEQRVFGKLGILKRLKRRKPELLIGVLGCMAQNHQQALLDKLPHVNLVVGTDQLQRLPELLQQAHSSAAGLVAADFGAETGARPQGHLPGNVSAFIAVMRGCDQFCSYCIVPYVRGREKSRGIPDIIEEVRTVVSQGAREIFLLGQNITAYGLAEKKSRKLDDTMPSPFAELLRAVAKEPGVERIRFTSPHPKLVNADLIQALAELPAVCPAFHFPLQSGSERILKLMRRGYTAADYRRALTAIRRNIPETVFSTDIIVGFPGETEADFTATRELMNEIGFDMAYIFKYSPREGTKAAAQMQDDVPAEVKDERNQILLQDLGKYARRSNLAAVGTLVEVLVEGVSRRNPQMWNGRNRAGKVCLFPPAAEIKTGDIREFRVDRTTANALYCSLERLGAEADTAAVTR